VIPTLAEKYEIAKTYDPNAATVGIHSWDVRVCLSVFIQNGRTAEVLFPACSDPSLLCVLGVEYPFIRQNDT